MSNQSGVVVTAMGLAVPPGLSLAEVWDRGVRGESSIGPIRRFQVDPRGCLASAEVQPFELAPMLRFPKNEKFMGAGVRFAMHAVKSALASSDVDLGRFDPCRVALHTGSGQTGLEAAEFFRALDLAAGGDEAADFANLGGRASRLIDRNWSIRTLSNAGIAFFSTELCTKGASSNVVQGETASAVAMASAFHDLSEGRCDLAFVLGYDSLVSQSSYLAHERAGLLSHLEPARAYRPFDRDRDGLVLGEGGAALVLEREDDARRRGATILAEITGVGLSMDATPGGDATRALRVAIAEAIGDARPDFVVARGIGSVEGDRDEMQLLEASIEPGTPVTALKSQTGYLGAATAAVEVVLAIQSVRKRQIPPIARHDVPDDNCRLALVSRAAERLSGERPTGLCLAQSWFGSRTAIGVRASRT